MRTAEMELSMRDKALSCTVVSLIPWDLFEEKPGLIPGKFAIPASVVKNGKRIPTVKHVLNSTFHYVYLDDTRGSLQARDPSDEVAASIVRDYVGSQLGVSDDAVPGLFWLPGHLSVEEVVRDHQEELQKFDGLQNNWFLNLSRIADDDWTRYRKHTVISDFQRTAATLIGWRKEDHEWLDASIKIETGPKEPVPVCVACQSPVSPKAIICPNCRCILKPDEYKKLIFAMENQKQGV